MSITALYLLYVDAAMDVCATACLKKSEWNLWGSGLSFHNEVLGNGLKSWGLVMLGDKPLNLALPLSTYLLKLFHFFIYLFGVCGGMCVCVVYVNSLSKACPCRDRGDRKCPL